VGFELKTLVVIGIDYTGSWKAPLNEIFHNFIKIDLMTVH